MPERPSARPEIAALEGYHSPQVDVEVRLNTNESPFPPPEGWVDALADALRDLRLNRYPDRAAGELRGALAARYGVDAQQVFCANGSNEVIQSLFLAYGGFGRSVAVFEPTYTMYAQIARFTGTRVVRGCREPDFSLDLPTVAALLDAERPNLVVLCSPNNPTGTLESGNLISEVVEAAGSYGGLVVVDEAYGQFSPHSAVDLLDNDWNLVVSRTFSKTWAMAGARIGYLLAPSWCVAELEKVALPYHLDAFKRVAGELALAHGSAMDQRISILVSERERMAAALKALSVTAWPSAANFILFRPETRPGREVWQDLIDRSVLVRDFTTMEGVEGCLRVTIGTGEENDRFLEALREALS